MADNLQDAIKDALLHVPVKPRLQKHHLMIANQDGICLFSNKKDASDISLGALLGGVWQASRALLDVKKIGHSRISELRLAYDDGENGFCVVAVEIAGRLSYACLLFSNEVAPGAVRTQLRHWCDDLAECLKDWKAPASRSGYLFKDVTDEEIDRLFGFGSNECRS